MPQDRWGDLESTFGPQVLTLSPKERDYAARTLLAEAKDQGDLGQAAVMHVIKNRAMHGGFGQGVEGVITKPYAFEPWLHAGKGRGNDPLAYAADDPAYLRAAKIVDAVAAGEIPDPTHGATHFYSPTSQRQLASLDNRALTPSWAKPEAMTTKIGGHEFYNLADGTPKGKKVIPVTRGVPIDYDWAGEAYKEHQEQKRGVLPPAPQFLLDAQKEQPSPQPTLPQSPIQPAPDWSALQSATTGATLGAWPYIKAGVQTLGDYTEGKGPSTGEPTGMKGTFEKNLADIQEQRTRYQTQNPITNLLSEGTGAIVGAALPIGLTARGVATGGRALGEALPAIKPALEAAGRFVTGRTAENAPGFLAGAQRAASYAAQGATQGAGQAAFTRALQPEDTDFGTNVLWGAGGGALLGSTLNPFLSRVAAPFKAEIPPHVRQMAQDVNAKYDLAMRPTQIARDAEVNALDRAVIPQHVADAQVMKFNEELGKQLGLAGKELTRENFQAEMRKVGDRLSQIAASSTMKPTRSVAQALGDIRADVYATTLAGNPLRQKVDDILVKLYNELVAGGGNLPGNKFRDFVKKGGLLDKELLTSADPSAKTLGYQLKNKMFEMFEVSDPVKAAEYSAARKAYHKLATLEPLANPSGVIDPTKVLAKATKKGVTGEIEELGQAGRYMPGVTPTGSARLPPKPKTFEQIKHTALNAIPMLTSGASYLLGVPTGAVAAGASILGGGQYLGGHLRNLAMASPLVGRAVLSGKYADPITPFENVLARGAANITTEVGAERKKRK